MNKIFLLIMLATLSFAQEYKANYGVEFAFLGKIGEAKMSYKNDGQTYQIDVVTQPAELINRFSDNREESFHSRGEVKNGVLFPTQFVRHVKTDKSDITTLYSFDYKHKKIIEKTSGIKRVESSYMDIANLSIKKKLISHNIEQTQELDYFSANDLLTLFFNISHIVHDTQGLKTIHAVGATKSGEIKLSRIDGSEFDRIRSKMNADVQTLIAVNVTKRIFSDDNGKLYIGFDKDGVLLEALLNNVTFFGDIKGEKISN